MTEREYKIVCMGDSLRVDNDKTYIQSPYLVERCTMMQLTVLAIENTAPGDYMSRIDDALSALEVSDTTLLPIFGPDEEVYYIEL